MSFKKILLCAAVSVCAILSAACGIGMPKIKTVDEFAEIGKSQGFSVNTAKVDEAFRGEGDPVEEAFAYKDGMEVYFDVFSEDADALERYSARGGIIDDSHKKGNVYITESNSGIYDGSIRVVKDGPVVVSYEILDNCPNKEAAKIEMTNLSNSIGY